MTEKPLNVGTAYGLQGPDDNRKLYADWAETYDSDFADAKAYLLPAHVARLFHAAGGKGPVLDAGAGTGLVAAELLARGVMEIDGLDISAQMLEVARGKGLYRETLVADLTAPLPIGDDVYAAVTSAGTFTHGHVGPEALDELLRVAASGALFVITIKREHYADRGFAAKFAALEAQITAFSTETLPIYDGAADAPQPVDQGILAVFRKR